MSLLALSPLDHCSQHQPTPSQHGDSRSFRQQEPYPQNSSRIYTGSIHLASESLQPLQPSPSMPHLPRIGRQLLQPMVSSADDAPAGLKEIDPPWSRGSCTSLRRVVSGKSSNIPHAVQYPGASEVGTQAGTSVIATSGSTQQRPHGFNAESLWVPQAATAHLRPNYSHASRQASHTQKLSRADPYFGLHQCDECTDCLHSYKPVDRTWQGFFQSEEA